MGQSTDAILFYGYCWNEEDKRYPWDDDEDEGVGEDEEEEEDAAERYARLAHGVLPPEEPYPEDGDHTSRANRSRKAYDVYWDTKRKLYEAAGVGVDQHCSGECPMPFVAVKASVLLAHRGYPARVESIAIDRNWDELLREFCSTMQIKPPRKQKPGWYLVSYWG